MCNDEWACRMTYSVCDNDHRFAFPSGESAHQMTSAPDVGPFHMTGGIVGSHLVAQSWAKMMI